MMGRVQKSLASEGTSAKSRAAFHEPAAVFVTFDRKADAQLCLDHFDLSHFPTLHMMPRAAKWLLFWWLPRQWRRQIGVGKQGPLVRGKRLPPAPFFSASVPGHAGAPYHCQVSAAVQVSGLQWGRLSFWWHERIAREVASAFLSASIIVSTLLLVLFIKVLASTKLFSQQASIGKTMAFIVFSIKMAYKETARKQAHSIEVHMGIDGYAFSVTKKVLFVVAILYTFGQIFIPCPAPLDQTYTVCTIGRVAHGMRAHGAFSQAATPGGPYDPPTDRQYGIMMDLMGNLNTSIAMTFMLDILDKNLSALDLAGRWGRRKGNLKKAISVKKLRELHARPQFVLESRAPQMGALMALMLFWGNIFVRAVPHPIRYPLLLLTRFRTGVCTLRVLRVAPSGRRQRPLHGLPCGLVTGAVLSQDNDAPIVRAARVLFIGATQLRAFNPIPWLLRNDVNVYYVMIVGSLVLFGVVVRIALELFAVCIAKGGTDVEGTPYHAISRLIGSYRAPVAVWGDDSLNMGVFWRDPSVQLADDDEGDEEGTQELENVPAGAVAEADSAALFAAIKEGDVEALRAMVVAQPVLLDATDEWGASPLHAAAVADSNGVALVEMLLDFGADPLTLVNGAPKTRPYDVAKPGQKAALRARAVSKSKAGVAASAPTSDPTSPAPLLAPAGSGKKARSTL